MCGSGADRMGRSALAPLPVLERALLVAARLVIAASPLLVNAALPGAASAGPKKALGDYSQFCQDAHLECLNDCQAGPPRGYSSEADILACMGVCDDWLDDACDRFRPKALVRTPESVRPPLSGVITPGQIAPQRRVPKVPPTGGIAQ